MRWRRWRGAAGLIESVAGPGVGDGEVNTAWRATYLSGEFHDAESSRLQDAAFLEYDGAKPRPRVALSNTRAPESRIISGRPETPGGGAIQNEFGEQNDLRCPRGPAQVSHSSRARRTSPHLVNLRRDLLLALCFTLLPPTPPPHCALVHLAMELLSTTTSKHVLAFLDDEDIARSSSSDRCWATHCKDDLQQIMW